MAVKRRVTQSDYVDAEQSVEEKSLEPDRKGAEFSKLLEGSEENFKEGSIVTGRVMKKDKNSVIIDIGFKSEGLVPLSEFTERDETVEVGEEVEVMLESLENRDGALTLSKRKARRARVWDEINIKYESGEPIEGTPVSKIKGGLVVDIGLNAFLPGSQVDLRPIKKLEQMLGETFEFKIIKMNRKRGNIVLSRRALLEEARKISKEHALETLKEGNVVEGIVKNITDYGAFVDLGGMDGLLHITDMSWGRVGHPSELFSIGDSINVMILKLDKENEKVSLGLKQTTPDPWVGALDKYAPGARVNCRVVSLTDYGAFLELEEGIEGLVHISEMSWSKNARFPSKILSRDERVDAVVLSIDAERKRISLGMKQIQENPWDRIEERFPIGSVVEGTARNLTDFGVFVELMEGVDGLIHISDMSWTRKIKHPSELVRKRDTLKVMVLAIDKENGRLSLGLKQLEKDPWENISERYPVGAEVKCVATKVMNFGAFAELEEGVEGLIHVSQLSTSHVVNPRKVIRVGQEVMAKVIRVEPAERKLGLSIKAFLEGLAPEDIEREFAASGEGRLSSDSADDVDDQESAEDESVSTADPESVEAASTEDESSSRDEESESKEG